MSAWRASPREVAALGQLLWVSIEGDRWSSALERRLRALQPGGVLLGARNLRSPGSTAALLAKIARTLDTPPFLVIEEEGGSVDPLRKFLPPLPSPQHAARKGSSAVARLGDLIGAALKLLGFNTNLAPRLDLQSPLVKPTLNRQTFGEDSQTVAKCGKALIGGLRRQGIRPCGKHFPGLGAAEFGLQEVLPVVDKPMAALWREDLVPFRELLPSLPLVKVAYAAYKAYDFDVAVPTSLSSNTLLGLLRVKLGYRGVAVGDLFQVLETLQGISSDSPEVGPKVGAFLFIRAFAKSINAGCDVQVIRWGGRMLELAYESLRKALDDGTLAPRRVEEALRRIRRAKKGIHYPVGRFSKRAFDLLVRRFEDFSKSC